jgi:hypothetical protein
MYLSPTIRGGTRGGEQGPWPPMRPKIFRTPLDSGPAHGSRRVYSRTKTPRVACVASVSDVPVPLCRGEELALAVKEPTPPSTSKLAGVQANAEPPRASSRQ